MLPLDELTVRVLSKPLDAYVLASLAPPGELITATRPAAS
jgi:hypothetical protein